LGTKNRIFLGIVIALISHNHRNVFKKNIYMSKRVQSKIKLKHSNNFYFTNQLSFTELLENTIGSCNYDENKHTVNFIAHIKSQNRYIMFSLKSDNHYTVCNTIFSLRADTLKKYYVREDFKLFNGSYKEIIEEYLKA